MTQVHLHKLTKVFKGVREVVAVRDFDLDIASGKITALLGPSGCGKTTTLKMIAGLLEPTSGDVTFDGDSVAHIAAEKRGAAMVFQNYLLFPYMTVGQNVGFGLRMRHVDKKTIAERVSEMTGTAAGARRTAAQTALRRPAAAYRPGPGAHHRAQGLATGRTIEQPGRPPAG